MSRSIPAHFTPEQRVFLTAVTTSRRHLFLRATAGAGKTTTLSEAAWHLIERGVYFVYNKHAVADFQPRLPDRMRALPLHAHGYRLMQGLSDAPLQSKDNLARTIAGLILRTQPALQAPAARAWTIAREEFLRGPTREQAQWLADRAQWPAAPGQLIHLIPLFHDFGHSAWKAERWLDFTDLLWLPLRLGVGGASLTLALVDEAQDLTPLRQAYLLCHLGAGPAPLGLGGGRAHLVVLLALRVRDL